MHLFCFICRGNGPLFCSWTKPPALWTMLQSHTAWDGDGVGFQGKKFVYKKGDLDLFPMFQNHHILGWFGWCFHMFSYVFCLGWQIPRKMIQQTIDSLQSTVGTLGIVSIAHRLSTVRSAEKIYVLSHGSLVENLGEAISGAVRDRG